MNPRALAGLAGLAACVVLGAAIALTSSPVVALTLCAVIVVVALFAYDPAVGVLAYAASRPIVDGFVFLRVGPFSVGQLWGAGLIALCSAFLVLDLMHEKDRESRGSSMWPLVFLGAYAGFSLARPGFDAALTNSLRLAGWVLVIVALERIARTERGRDRIVNAGLVGAVLIVIVVAYAIVQNRYGAAYYAGEFDAVGQGPHGLSSYAVLSCTFVLYAILTKRGGRWLYVLLGALIVAVVASLVRTTLIALMALMVMYVLVALVGRGRRALFGALALLVVVGMAVYFAQDLLVERFRDVSYVSLGGGTREWAGSGRVGIWEAVWEGTIAKPTTFVWGAGAAFSSSLVFASLGVERWAHNDFLEFFATGGILLTAAYTALVVWMGVLARRLWKSPDHAAHSFGGVYGGAVIAFVIMAFFNGIALYQASMVMALLTGLAAGWVRDSGAIGASSPGAGRLS